MPGRRLPLCGCARSWLFVDEWFVIGPFPSPHRVNRLKEFLPEQRVNLDDSFPGEGEEHLLWKRVQANMPPVWPPGQGQQSVSYAWTEIWSPREQTVWFIFGSDDFGKAWVCGQVVYQSGLSPHPWIPVRGYAKVSLRKGANDVLFRVENAGGLTAFSCMIYLGPMLE